MIVGKGDERRIIRGSRVVAVGVVLALFVGCGAGVVQEMLSGAWEVRPGLLGIAFGVGIAGVGLRNGVKTGALAFRACWNQDLNTARMAVPRIGVIAW